VLGGPNGPVVLGDEDFPERVPPDLSKMRPVDPSHVVAAEALQAKLDAVSARLRPPADGDPQRTAPDPVAAAQASVARMARALLRGVVSESRKRDGAEVALVVNAEQLRVLREAVTLWDDAAHAQIVGGGR
jgi:hypothetical protein